MTFLGEDLLYHYTSAATALGSILPLRQLRLGQFEFTNDPRESQQWFVSASVGEGEEMEEGHFEYLIAEADRLMRRSVKLACFTKDSPPRSDFDEVSGRGFGHSHLWSQYAGNHSGVCIGFDRTKLLAALWSQLSDLGLYRSEEVRYVADPSPPLEATRFDLAQVDEFGLDALVAARAQRYWRELFFTKDLDWGEEHEHRCVVLTPDPAPVFADISGCIRAVVLGDRFPPAQIPAVHHAARLVGDVVVVALKYRTGRPFVLPALPESAAPAPRPVRRPGDVDKRTQALFEAEDEAEEAREKGTLDAAAALAALAGAVKVCEARLRELDEAIVRMHSSGSSAVPLAQRMSAAGVTGGDVEYSGGVLCVAEQQLHDRTLAVAVAAQVLRGQRVRLHAVVWCERQGKSSSRHEEVWRGQRLAATIEDADDLARELAMELVQNLDEGVAAFMA